MIHGEFMTHRVFSRNASSSRAIPNWKLRQECRRADLRVTPVNWGMNKKGMQSSENLSGWRLALAKFAWGAAAHTAANASWLMEKAGLHKQWANRVLEPFTHINVMMSTTELENFLGLRLEEGAQPEIIILAQKILEAFHDYGPAEILSPGQWHLPLVETEDYHLLGEEDGFCLGARIDSPAIKVCVSRCARVTHESFETGRRSTPEEDIALFARLLSSRPLHASPAEHAATPDTQFPNGSWANPSLHGNFVGFCQFRKMLDGENKAPLPEGYSL